MLYHLYFDGLAYGLPHDPSGGWNDQPKPRADSFKLIHELLKNSKHSLLFIITKNQWSRWEAAVEKYKLKEFVFFEMPYFVSNYVYGGSKTTPGRKLRVVILKGKGQEV